jgi:DNA-binding transcriptional LysR family regulator
MDISIGKLQQLVMVARTGSFSKAAGELNISQPAISRSIAAIEARYGFKIFNRVGNGVRLTAAGAQVVVQAEPLLRGMRVFDQNLRLFGSGQAGQLRFGLAPLLASEILARFTGEFFTPHRGVQLRVMVRPGADLLDALRNEMIEFLFFPQGHLEPSPDIVIRTIGRIAPACVVRRGHPLASREKVALEDLKNFPWGSSMEGSLPKEIPSMARFACDNYHILREAVISSDLICICSQAFVAKDLAESTLREIAIVDLPLPPATIYMAELHGRMHSPLAVEAIEWITRYIEGQTAIIR